MKDISDEEIISFRKNKIEMDLVYVNDIIFLILSIDNVIHILDASFHIKLTKTDLEALELKDEESYTLSLFLIDTKNNVLKAIRLIGLSEVVLMTLKQLIEKQMKKSFGRMEYKANITKIYNMFSPQNLKQMSTCHFTSVSK